MSISARIEQLASAKDSISGAITQMGGTVNSGDGFADFSADILTIPARVDPVVEKDVNFYDYDGTVLYAYTKAQALALSALPAQPTHSGLTCEGWNWTLAQMQSYVANYGICDVGALYSTDNGETRLYLHITEEVPLSFTLYTKIADGTLTLKVNGVTVTTESESSAAMTAHTLSFTLQPPQAYPFDVTVQLQFSGEGGYTIGQGAVAKRVLGGNSAQNNALTKVELGTGVTSIVSAAYQGCSSLNSILIPEGVTSIEQAFFACASLNRLVIPRGVTSILLKKCASLCRVILPWGITSLNASAFYDCSLLSRIVIPDSITSIDNTTFCGCLSLRCFAIPAGVTSIGQTAFQECKSANSIRIPNTVRSIAARAFAECHVLFVLDLADYTDPATLPSMPSTSLLNSPSDQVIYVYDQACLDALFSMAGWSSFASRMQIKSQG